MTVTYDYTGKAVLVTGGTKGIGAAIARAFHEAGATVTICARTPPASAADRPTRTPPTSAADMPTHIPPASAADMPARTPPASCAATGEIRFVQADVRVPEDVDRLISGFGRLDVVVNNAGGSPYAPLDGTSPRLHARVIDLNLTAPLLVAQRAYPLLAASCGAIVMIGSVSGSRPSPGTAAYGAAKAGLHHLARCLAAEWAPQVRVNTIVVGLTTTAAATTHYNPHHRTTPATHHDGGTHDGRGIQPGSTGSPDGGVVTAAGGHGPDQDGGSAEGGGAPGNGETGTGLIAATIPAGRMATPTDVAQVCLWLAAPGYVTGAEVRVDGGGEIPAWRHLTA